MRIALDAKLNEQNWTRLGRTVLCARSSRLNGRHNTTAFNPGISWLLKRFERTGLALI